MSNNVQVDSKKHELEEIHGIGPKIRAALVEGGVQTLADLAGSSGDKIESILKTSLYKGKRIPSNLQPEQWIEDANAMLPAQQKSVAQTDSASADSQLATVPEFTAFFNYGFINDGPKRWRAVIHPRLEATRTRIKDSYTTYTSVHW